MQTTTPKQIDDTLRPERRAIASGRSCIVATFLAPSVGALVPGAQRSAGNRWTGGTQTAPFTTMLATAGSCTRPLSSGDVP
jgi:hypothetical protein